MYLYSEWCGECFEDDDNDGLYHPNQLHPKPPEPVQERASTVELQWVNADTSVGSQS